MTKLRKYVANHQARSVLVTTESDSPAEIQGVTFFRRTASVDYGDSPVSLAGSPDTANELYVDDILTVYVRRPDGSFRSMVHDFSNGCDGVGLRPVPSVDITGLLAAGQYQVTIALSDACGQNNGNSDIYLLTDGTSTATVD